MYGINKTPLSRWRNPEETAWNSLLAPATTIGATGWKARVTQKKKQIIYFYRSMTHWCAFFTVYRHIYLSISFYVSLLYLKVLQFFLHFSAFRASFAFRCFFWAAKKPNTCSDEHLLGAVEFAGEPRGVAVNIIRLVRCSGWLLVHIGSYWVLWSSIATRKNDWKNLRSKLVVLLFLITIAISCWQNMLRCLPTKLEFSSACQEGWTFEVWKVAKIVLQWIFQRPFFPNKWWCVEAYGLPYFSKPS